MATRTECPDCERWFTAPECPICGWRAMPIQAYKPWVPPVVSPLSPDDHHRAAGLVLAIVDGDVTPAQAHACYDAMGWPAFP